MDFFGYIGDVVFRLMGSNGDVNKFFEKRGGVKGTADLSALIAYVATYQPNGTYYDYLPEMDNRIKYLEGQMQGDMKAILKRQLPQTHKDYEREQANFRLVKSIIAERARVFPESTQYVLKGRARRQRRRLAGQGTSEHDQGWRLANGIP
jgi:hypothetical protein